MYTGNWAAFASQCCCRDHEWEPTLNVSAIHRGAYNASSPLNRLELWTCPDLSPTNSSSGGVLHKLRTRVELDASGGVAASGLHVRPFCSPVFADGFLEPTYDESLLAFVVMSTNSSVAATALW